MIVSKDLNPRRELYYLGALVLQLLQEDGQYRMDFFELFHRLNEREKVSIRLFSLTLSWLFLLDKVNSKGSVVELCS